MDSRLFNNVSRIKETNMAKLNNKEIARMLMACAEMAEYKEYGSLSWRLVDLLGEIKDSKETSHLDLMGLYSPTGKGYMLINVRE